uniref:Uncharacterized protein n=1 Tax=Meloidogyne enterolobii TaxID=390850 RepID=A0A6V7W4Q9_MELEN|nr:unnamed protein product [Meloidogyne enterolobii]
MVQNVITTNVENSSQQNKYPLVSKLLNENVSKFDDNNEEKQQQKYTTSSSPSHLNFNNLSSSQNQQLQQQKYPQKQHLRRLSEPTILINNGQEEQQKLNLDINENIYQQQSKIRRRSREGQVTYLWSFYYIFFLINNIHQNTSNG